MEIRAATPEDAAEVARVHVASFRDAHAGLLPEDFLQTLSVEAREEMWRRMLIERADTHFLFVAIDGERIIGFTAGGPAGAEPPGYCGLIYTIYLLPEAQGKGAGRGLLERALQEFRSRKCLSVILWVLKENIKARGFYEHLGGLLVAEKQEDFAGVPTNQVAYAWQLPAVDA